MPGVEDLSFRDIIAHLTKSEIEKMSGDAIPISEAKDSVTRNEIVAKIVSTLLGLAASFTFTYFGVKWLVNAMDPTRKDKQEAQARAQKMLEQLGVDNVKKAVAARTEPYG